MTESNFREPLADPADAIVDIVFVHGISGHPRNTWTANNGVFWPQDLLPKALPTARIFSWEHTASLTQVFRYKREQNTIDNFSEDLLRDIGSIRRATKTTERPLIFVAHSLGGIIVLNALLLAQSNRAEDLRDVSDHVHGIAFLGTPLRGSKWAELYEKLNKCLPDSLRASITTEDLKKGSRKLDEILKQAKNLIIGWQDDKIRRIFGVCFCESKGVAKFDYTKIVEEDSATLDFFRSFLLPGDHRTMCKFSSQDDEGFQAVKDTLDIWVTKAIEPPSTAQKSGIHIGGSQISHIYGGNNLASFYHSGSTPLIGDARAEYTYNMEHPQNGTQPKK